MYCNNCKKIIDNDSKFCIYCGSNSLSDIYTQNAENNNEKRERDLSNNKKLLLNKELEKEKNLSNYLLNKKNKYKILLAVFLPILSIAIILLSIFLAVNINEVNKIRSQIDTIESQKDSLLKEDKALLADNKSLEATLNTAHNNYDILNNQYSNEEKNNSSNQVNDNSSKSTNAEVEFFDKIYNLIYEYDLAINHMNVYHGESWIINDPQHIALEETFLVKLNELYETLVGFSYPNSLANERNNLVNISKELYDIRVAEVEFMRNNDYPNYANYNDLWNNTMQKFSDYYNSIIK